MGDPMPRRLDMADADVLFYAELFSGPESDGLLRELTESIPWEQKQIRVFGKRVDEPRLSSWHGDAGKAYRYSGITVVPKPWTPPLLAIKQVIEPVSGVSFNSVLLNLYRGERDSIGWHSDDEPELGVNPAIGSVSFGETRRFQLRHKHDRRLRLDLDLTHGSFLLMRGPTQHFWQHQVPKVSGSRGPRINLTFRSIL